MPNGFKKYMAFIMNKKLVFIDNMQFINSSLEALVKQIVILNIYLKNVVVNK